MRPNLRGFTVLEVLAVVTLILILVGLSFPAWEKIRPAAEAALCRNNLKNLHAVFGAYAIEGWPQVPKGVKLGSTAEQRWWLEKTEKELGLTEKSWQCPTIRRQFASVPQKDRPLIHYLPTPFSKEPNRANKSARMPWFIEIGNAHGQGNLLIRQNGDVESSTK